MSAASGKPVPAASWDIDVEAGDPVTLLGRPYVFERVDPDGAVTFRAPAGSGGGDFLVVDDSGQRRKPTVEEVLALSDEDLVWHEKPLAKEARRFARAQELNAAQAHAMDVLSEFRMAIPRRFDASPWSRSDASLRAFMQEALTDPVIAAMPGAWAASPATLRTWINDRGTEGCRKERDGISMKNRMRSIRKLKHPLEIVFYHAAAATNARGSVQMNHDKYVAEIADINAGRPLRRCRFDFDRQDDGGMRGLSGAAHAVCRDRLHALLAPLPRPPRRGGLRPQDDEAGCLPAVWRWRARRPADPPGRALLD